MTHKHAQTLFAFLPHYHGNSNSFCYTIDSLLLSHLLSSSCFPFSYLVFESVHSRHLPLVYANKAAPILCLPKKKEKKSQQSLLATSILVYLPGVPS